MRNIFYLIVAIVFSINNLAHAGDSIYFIEAFDTLIVNVENSKNSNPHICQGGKVYVCPDEFGNYSIVFQLGFEDNGTFYEISTPDFHFYNNYIKKLTMPGDFGFKKTVSGITYQASIQIIWIQCPSNAPVPNGKDTICANDSSVFSINEFYNGDYYQWYNLPAESGKINDSDTLIYFTPNPDYHGESQLRVMAVKGMPDDGNDAISRVFSTFIKPFPFAQFRYDVLNHQVTFSNLSANADQYMWFFDNNKQDTVTNPSFVFNENGNYEVRLISLNTCGSDTAIENILITEMPGIIKTPNIRVYPSVIKNEMMIEIKEPDLSFPLDLSIYNIIGEKVYSEKIDINTKRLNLSKLENGTYIISFLINNKRFANRIFICK